MQYTNLNGKITTAASLPADNGAFRYGYGLFETMLVQHGTIQLAQYHWDRLFAGMAQLYFAPPALMTPQYLQEQVLRTVTRNKVDTLCRVRLQVYAGGGGLYNSDIRQPLFIIECFPLEPDNGVLNENGLIAGIATGLAKSPDTLGNIKSCSALIYAIAAKQAREHKWNDALITNTSGHIVESTIANIFWVKDSTIHTPPLSDGCVAGVMRRHIMATFPVTEKSLSAGELLQADEVFLTNAIKKICWVAGIGNKQYTCSVIQAIRSVL